MIDCATAATKSKGQWCKSSGWLSGCENHRPPALAPCLCRFPSAEVDWLAARFFVFVTKLRPRSCCTAHRLVRQRRRRCWRVAYGSLSQQELQPVEVESSEAPEQGFRMMEHWRLLKSNIKGKQGYPVRSSKEGGRGTRQQSVEGAKEVR